MGAVNGGSPEGGGQKVVGRAVFPLPHRISFSFLSLPGLLVEMLPRFNAVAYQKCPFRLLWGHFVIPQRLVGCRRTLTGVGLPSTEKLSVVPLQT